MPARRLLRVLMIGWSASLYVEVAPYHRVQPARGPMRARAIVRPPRLEATPPGSAR